MEKELKKYMLEFEEYMEGNLNRYANDSDTLKSAMTYALSTGGKRFRPMLLLAVVQFGNGDMTQAFPVAAALEWIHTYSLIHDDLPAMDNDDYRRGKLTTHKKFNEAIAILAGDAMLTTAFTMILDHEELPLNKRVQLAKNLAVAAGPKGMVSGQMADIEGESKELTLEELQAIHRQKTGALIEYAISAGSLIADIPVNASISLLSYAKHLGLAYQIHNDLKDVVYDSDQSGKKAGQDAELGKNTYPSLLGLEPALKQLEGEIEAAEKEINNLARSLESGTYNLESLNILLQMMDYVRIEMGA
ncbi:polyprenyl synthetase family protein [Jeotgalibaca sp. A127]